MTPLDMLVREHVATAEAERLMWQRFYRLVADCIDSKLVRQGDLAKALGVSREAVRLWAHKGRAM